VPNGGDRQELARGDLGPLPGGHHGLSPQQVAESQRERLLAATAELIAERGYGPAPITEIAKRASVANRVFYANFETKEAAFVAAFDAVADHLSALIAEAAAAEEEWPRRVVAALRATAVFFDSEPKLARFCFVAPFTATKAIAAHCRDRVAQALPFLDAGRRFGTSGAELPASTEDSLLGGVVSQLSRSILAENGPLVALLPDLVEFVLSPYLGTEQARALGAEAAR
jgi:AcrR family transcriptional regulator